MRKGKHFRLYIGYSLFYHFGGICHFFVMNFIFVLDKSFIKNFKFAFLLLFQVFLALFD